MTMQNLIDQTFSLRLTLALIHFLWQGVLIAVVAAVAARLLQRASAGTRYAVHVAALALMPVCVAVTFSCIAIDAPSPTPASSGQTAPANVVNRSSAATPDPDGVRVDQVSTQLSEAAPIR